MTGISAPLYLGFQARRSALGAAYVREVVLGDGFSCLLLDYYGGSSAVRCYGSNSHGQLGRGIVAGSITTLGTTDDPADDVDLGSGMGRIVQVVAARTSACALAASGTVKCWGGDDEGGAILGTSQHSATGVSFVGQSAEDMGDSLAPVDFGFADRPTALAAGPYHVCAVLQDSGGFVCWGGSATAMSAYDYAPLARSCECDGATGGSGGPVGNSIWEMSCQQPKTLPGGAIVSLSAAADRTCAVVANGWVYCWGRNDVGASVPTLGHSALDHFGSCSGGGAVWPPPRVSTNKHFAGKVAAYEGGACFVDSDTNHVRCFGEGGPGPERAGPSGRTAALERWQR